MAIQDAMVVGVEPILQEFKRAAKTPYCAIFLRQVCCFYYDGEDEEDGYNELQNWLSAREKQGFRDIISLRTYRKKEKLGFKYTTDPDITIQCRIAYHDVEAARAYVYGNNPVNNEILEKLNGISSRLTALEKPEEIIEEEEEPDSMAKINGVIGTVSALLEHPIINGLISKFINMPAPQPAAISGIENDYENAVNILRRVDPDFELDICKLALIAEKKPTAFKVLIAELREFKV